MLSHPARVTSAATTTVAPTPQAHRCPLFLSSPSKEQGSGSPRIACLPMTTTPPEMPPRSRTVHKTSN